ncbi:hypothetical protein [Micromonospora sp. RV43]|uniref:hypothetical protein n=1 Tax=Micromonospora TaxID=1873 RepID=UPI00064B8286|nr:hypothetical protein [Micromonospora sp. RV43]
MTFQGWRVMVACLLAALGSSAVSILYTNASAHQSERQWCGVVTTMDDAYRQTPPQTPAGRKIAKDIAQLRIDFGC